MPPANPQLELSFQALPAPKVSAEDVDALCRVLRGRPWTSAGTIAVRVRDILPRVIWTDRKIRAIAEASDAAVVSFPGSPGYALFDEATEAEISHAIEAIRSQGKRMIARSQALETRHHQRRLVDRPQPQP